MKTKKLSLRILTLITAVVCITATLLGSTFKPMKTTYADENNSVFVDNPSLVKGEFEDITDFRQIKKGDVLSGVSIYFACDAASALKYESSLTIHFVKPSCHPNVEQNMPLDFSCVLFFTNDGEIRIPSLSGEALLLINDDLLQGEPVSFLIPDIKTCSDLVSDEYTCKSGCDYQLVVDSLDYTNEPILRYICVRDSEVINLYDDNKSDEPTEEPTDENPNDESKPTKDALNFDFSKILLACGLVLVVLACFGVAKRVKKNNNRVKKNNRRK